MKYLKDVLWFCHALSQRVFSKSCLIFFLYILVASGWFYIGAAAQRLLMRPPLYSPEYPLGYELEHYISSYEELLNVDVGHIPVVWVERLPGNAVGACYFFPITAGRIVPYRLAIKRESWLHLSPLQRAGLVFHELGHCHLAMSHITSLRPDGCPKSLMFPSVMTDACLGRHWADYLRRLKRYANVKKKPPSHL